jgi:diguanylate cyclase (GGDEF)-like protein
MAGSYPCSPRTSTGCRRQRNAVLSMAVHCPRLSLPNLSHVPACCVSRPITHASWHLSERARFRFRQLAVTRRLRDRDATSSPLRRRARRNTGRRLDSWRKHLEQRLLIDSPLNSPLKKLERGSPLKYLLGNNALLSVYPMSLNDGLTQLHNREGFICAGAQLLEGTGPGQRWAFLLSLQVNHWKVVNHALGSEVGDRLLTCAAASLREVFRRSAIIGRLSTDRFAVLARVASPFACTALLRRLTDVTDKHSPTIHGLPLSLSGGVTQFDPRCPVSIPQLLDHADLRMSAMSADKHRGVS